MTADSPPHPHGAVASPIAEGTAGPIPAAMPNDTAKWVARSSGWLRGPGSAIALRRLLMGLSGGSMVVSLILMLSGHAWLAARVFAGATLGSLLLLLALA